MFQKKVDLMMLLLDFMCLRCGAGSGKGVDVETVPEGLIVQEGHKRKEIWVEDTLDHDLILQRSGRENLRLRFKPVGLPGRFPNRRAYSSERG